jgi:hypothetical protein
VEHLPPPAVRRQLTIRMKKGNIDYSNPAA